VERIDEVPAAGFRAFKPVGLGPEMRPWGRKFMPTNPHRWPKAGALGLVWRPRIVPRTHGTRAATGLRPAGHYEPPARSSLTIREVRTKARPAAETRTPPVERREASIPRSLFAQTA